MSVDWSVEEVEAIVADHLYMLTLELAGQSFNKTEQRRQLQAKLSGRSDGSIEFNRDCPLAESAGATQPSWPMISNGYH